jgi:hypothetical protein
MRVGQALRRTDALMPNNSLHGWHVYADLAGSFRLKRSDFWAEMESKESTS